MILFVCSEFSYKDFNGMFGKPMVQPLSNIFQVVSKPFFVPIILEIDGFLYVLYGLSKQAILCKFEVKEGKLVKLNSLVFELQFDVVSGGMTCKKDGKDTILFIAVGKSLFLVKDMEKKAQEIPLDRVVISSPSVVIEQDKIQVFIVNVSGGFAELTLDRKLKLIDSRDFTSEIVSNEIPVPYPSIVVLEKVLILNGLGSVSFIDRASLKELGKIDFSSKEQLGRSVISFNKGFACGSKSEVKFFWIDSLFTENSLETNEKTQKLDFKITKESTLDVGVTADLVSYENFLLTVNDKEFKVFNKDKSLVYLFTSPEKLSKPILEGDKAYLFSKNFIFIFSLEKGNFSVIPYDSIGLDRVSQALGSAHLIDQTSGKETLCFLFISEKGDLFITPMIQK